MLENWLNPIDPMAICAYDQLASVHLGRKLLIHYQSFPDLRMAKVALIGIDETEANAVRKALYPLAFSFPMGQVVDLGNVRKADADFLIPVTRELLDGGIIPILIGRQDTNAYIQFQAYRSHQLVNLVAVDQAVPYLPDQEIDSYLSRILNAQDSPLFNLGMIGYQSHFTPPVVLDFLETHYYDHIRLGQARSKMEELEPIIRDADAMSFNVAALKSAEAPAQINPSVSGFFSEEACRICRYAGLSDKMHSIGFYGFDAPNDSHGRTAQVIAQMIWYFMGGVFSRKGDYPISTHGLVEYIVEIKQMTYPLTFFRSEKTGRWWMQVPTQTDIRHQRHRLIPCSYQDYQSAGQDELPDRLINAYKRFSI